MNTPMLKGLRKDCAQYCFYRSANVPANNFRELCKLNRMIEKRLYEIEKLLAKVNSLTTVSEAPSHENN